MLINLMKLWPNKLMIFLVLFGKVDASTSPEVFRKYLNPTFIETGSFVGDSIAYALQVGYSEIHSIELAPHLYKKCCDRFKSYPQVHLYLGDSSVVLKDVLTKIKTRATFWLDGHYSANGTAIGNTNTPILQELALIATHDIKNHTILIDDVRLFGSFEHDFIELQEVIDAIQRINSNYHILFEPGIVPNDVLVAYIP